ncbi:MAG: protoheme IX farnesyltransferase [Gemmatimonadetes bacterium]|nr:protoheme IX farnesyltransferase [Gemmatimonadota bacterium]MXY49838.1 protoheme IX farnesyltransferase [Gemmatimonadota bacterium]MYD27229.1 protoheme IX farnesyltransferase [Gemmatimonadota bacterium]MYG85144.1 protoheme IX farnesyltransferase [Gemmatimonadota bacterium]MYI99822.1 protoheme IX farnesyltransferase [Gemmatimonadota bacterium]
MKDFIALTKPGLVIMLVLTTCVGFYLGSDGPVDWLRLLHTLAGTALAAGGTLALNQFMERDRDAMMRRTRKRPLPAGKLRPAQALGFGVAITVAGLLYLALVVNVLSCAVTALITVTYLFLYTPLKHRTTLSTVFGAVPGALPPVTGWAAARNELGLEAGVLFAILFLWQMPHALALAWLFREDYARAGFQLLPAVDPDGRFTSVQILINCLALTAFSLVPTILGISGVVYFYAAFAAGLGLLAFAIHLTVTRTQASARNLFFASLVFLLVQFSVMAYDKV